MWFGAIYKNIENLVGLQQQLYWERGLIVLHLFQKNVAVGAVRLYYIYFRTTYVAVGVVRLYYIHLGNT